MASGIDLMGGAISVRDGRSLNVGGIATSLGQITTHVHVAPSSSPPLHLNLIRQYLPPSPIRRRLVGAGRQPRVLF